MGDSQRPRRRAVFLDLNGTLVLPIKVATPREYRQIPGSPEAVAVLCEAGFVCPVVTVQSRIGRGMYTETEFQEWFQSFSDALADGGAFLAGPYVCPHRYNAACSCKKANGALYRKAATDLDIDLGSSFVVGDSLEDMEAARLLRCVGVAVRTGWDLGPEVEALCGHIADDLFAAARWITAHALTAQEAAAPGDRLEAAGNLS